MRIICALVFISFIAACSHPLVIVGEGDIVSSTGENDCALEEQPCANHVAGDYKVTYTAVPRSGWEFSRWQGCDIQFPACTFDVPGSIVDQFHGEVMPSLVAIFDQGLMQSVDEGMEQQAYLKDPGAESEDQFGSAIDLSRNTLVVGIPQKKRFVTGIDIHTGKPGMGAIRNVGAVSVFSRSSGTWKQQAYLTDGKELEDYCAGGDGVIVGRTYYCEPYDVYGHGAAHGSDFGRAVAVLGETLVVGAPRVPDFALREEEIGGEVHVFTRRDGLWSQTALLRPPAGKIRDKESQTYFFGSSLALSEDILAVGAEGSSIVRRGGAVYVFTRQNAAWKNTGFLESSTWSFGSSIAISGDTIVVGSPYADTGDHSDDSERYAGAVHVFRRIDEAWIETAVIGNPGSNSDKKSRDDKFGATVAISGDTLAIGAPGEDGAHAEQGPYGRGLGAVHIFRKRDRTWAREAYIENPTPSWANSFGDHIALSKDVLVVSNPQHTTEHDFSEGDNSFYNPRGVVQIFTREGGIWNLSDSLQSSNSELGDVFGESPAISGSTIVVGARGEDSSASGGQGDNSEPNSGAVYVFE